MQSIALGLWVRVAARPHLEEFLRAPDPRDRPGPQQMLCAGREARVLGVRLDPGREPRYVVGDLPGFWRETWLVPL